MSCGVAYPGCGLIETLGPPCVSYLGFFLELWRRELHKVLVIQCPGTSQQTLTGRSVGE